MRVFRNAVKFSLLVGTMIGAIILQSCGGKDPEEDPEPIPDPVVVNEDIFINEIYAAGDGDDWLELYNAGSEAKDVRGYAIYDDVVDKYIIPVNTIIPAKGFLILTCDGTGTGLHTNFKLSAGGETVSLETTEHKLIDMVKFPALEDGQSYLRYPDGKSNMVVTGVPTKGVTNGETQAPAISEVSKMPFIPSKNEPVKVTAIVTDNAGISSVKLFYRLDDALFSAASMTLTSGSSYEGTIPASGVDGKIEYYIEAKSNGNIIALSPADAHESPFSYIVNSDILPALFINEFMAANISCCPDTDGDVEEFDDWIEIYNAGDVAVDLAGMHLSDDPANPFKFKIPSTNFVKTTVQPGGFLVIWADETKLQGELHASFKLSNQGESVGLYYLDGRTIDEQTFGSQNDDSSFGRTTDGEGPLQVLSMPSPGSSNE